MRIRPLLALTVILLALLIGPLEARMDASRMTSANVASDDQSFVAIAIRSPVLTANNTYTDAAMTITHRHVSSTILSLSITTSDPGFTVRDGEATLSPGQSHTASIHAPDPEPAGTYRVDLTVSTDVISGGTSTGRHQVTRTVTVEVQ